MCCMCNCLMEAIDLLVILILCWVYCCMSTFCGHVRAPGVIHVLVELVQHHVGHQRREDTALRRSTPRFVPVPIFQVTSLQEFVDEIEKAFVGNILTE